MCETCSTASVLAELDPIQAMFECNVLVYNYNGRWSMYCIDCGAKYREHNGEFIEVPRFAKEKVRATTV